MSRKPSYYVEKPGELGTGPQIGGVRGHLTQASPGRLPIWKGPPPTFPAEKGVTPVRFRTLHLAARGPSETLGETVLLNVVAGNGMGGIITRDFRVGEGRSAVLRVGNFEHVTVVTGPRGCLSGQQLWFVWSLESFDDTCRLFNFLNYPIINVTTALPEGTIAIQAQNACVITFQIPEFAATFTVPVLAGQRIEAPWGAFSCNVVNQFFIEMRGL